MPEDEAVNQLEALDAIAAEQGGVLAFRVCEESGQFEPVFLRIFRANADEENETALLALSDQRGLSLGRYVINRGRLDRVLEEAEALSEDEPDEAAETAVVPLDWQHN